MRTRALLRCGILAGPVFVGGSLAHGVFRDGYQLSKHPVSLLSLGRYGWVQVAIFVVTGLLLIAAAIGLRRALRTGRGALWGPLLVGAFGAGLVVAGVFVTDAGAGFPAGAPDGAPPRISWHGWLHEIGTAIAFAGIAAGCLVFAARFRREGARAWVAGAWTAALLPFLVMGWPSAQWFSVRLLVASAIVLGFVAAVAHRYTSEDAEAPGLGRPGAQQ